MAACCTSHEREVEPVNHQIEFLGGLLDELAIVSHHIAIAPGNCLVSL